ncbi:MAG: GNAT family N-acetyltransferase [Bacteriovoracaceae bacterium]|nr:GNAT family N-acetyltransferase [Bacteriovoracaceae bacterium]
MALVINKACLEDVDELLKLYFEVYGNEYPVKFGTDRQIMIDTIESDSFEWLVARDTGINKIVGSVVFELDRADRVGKVSALVVKLTHRGSGIATKLVDSTVDRLLKEGVVDSMYTTVRTISMGPQLIFIKSGFLSLGIFPNAHKLHDFETFTLFVKFREGVLETRKALRTHGKLAPIYAVLNNELAERNIPVASVTFDTAPELPEQNIDIKLECITAANHVRRLFLKTFTDPYDRFYPFHQPNTLIETPDGETQIWAHLSKGDGYCAIVNFGKPVSELRGVMRSLLRLLREQGVSYIEVLIGAKNIASIEVLIQSQFLPSAVYPAMMIFDGVPTDFVVMSRSVEPLSFKGITIDSSFKPYMDQYVELWKQMHLDTLQVFNDYE